MKPIFNGIVYCLKDGCGKISSFFFAFLILFLASITLANASSYYVSLSGSDINSGSLNEPFRTIRHAVSKANPGDTVYVRGGDYRVNFPKKEYGYIGRIKGTSINPITITAYQEETPILSKISIKNSEWLVIDGFQITGYQPLLYNWKDLPEIIVDDPSVGAINPKEEWSTRELKVRKKYATYTELRSDFERSRTAGITIDNTHNCIVRNNEISKLWAGISIKGGSSKIKIDNNSIHHTVDAVFTWANSGLTSAEDNTISNNHFYQNIYSAVRLLKNAKGNIVENNLSEYNGVGHMDTYSGGTDNVFRNNTLVHSGYYAETMHYPGPSAISIHSAGPGNVVEGNFIAYQLDVTGNDGGGIITDYAKHKTIIRNNVLYRNMGHGFISTKSGKSTVVHNLFIENGYNSTMPKFGIHMSRDVDVDHVIANNIFYKNKTGGMSFGGIIDQQEYVDFNLFYQPGTIIVADNYWDSSTQYFDLSSYRKATGFGTHSIVGDPLFLDPENGNYRLSRQSSAIDAATPLHTASRDKDGNARPAGNGSDIGAYEYVPDSGSTKSASPPGLETGK